MTNRTTAKPAWRNSAGVTLIELLIVVTLISIILGVSIPGYRQYVMRAQRADATTALLRLAAAQERFYLQNSVYANAAQLELAPPAGLGFTGGVSERQYYNLTVVPGAGGLASSYIAIATPVPGENQAQDGDCALFSLNQSGQRTSLPGDIEICWR